MDVSKLSGLKEVTISPLGLRKFMLVALLLLLSTSVFAGTCKRNVIPQGCARGGTTVIVEPPRQFDPCPEFPNSAQALLNMFSGGSTLSVPVADTGALAKAIPAGSYAVDGLGGMSVGTASDGGLEFQLSGNYPQTAEQSVFDFLNSFRRETKTKTSPGRVTFSGSPVSVLGSVKKACPEVGLMAAAFLSQVQIASPRATTNVINLLLPVTNTVNRLPGLLLPPPALTTGVGGGETPLVGIALVNSGRSRAAAGLLLPGNLAVTGVTHIILPTGARQSVFRPGVPPPPPVGTYINPALNTISGHGGLLTPGGGGISVGAAALAMGGFSMVPGLF